MRENTRLEIISVIARYLRKFLLWAKQFSPSFPLFFFLLFLLPYYPSISDFVANSVTVRVQDVLKCNLLISIIYLPNYGKPLCYMVVNNEGGVTTLREFQIILILYFSMRIIMMICCVVVSCLLFFCSIYIYFHWNILYWLSSVTSVVSNYKFLLRFCSLCCTKQLGWVCTSIYTVYSYDNTDMKMVSRFLAMHSVWYKCFMEEIFI
jgi:hypothetical protein